MARELSKRGLAFSLAVLASSAFGVFLLGREAPRLIVFPAGKGAAALLTESGSTILFDTGPDASVLRVLGTALPPWQRHIDVVVLSGAPAGGLSAVERRYRVGSVLRFPPLPYGARLGGLPEDAAVIAPGVFRVAGMRVSSTTPIGTYK